MLAEKAEAPRVVEQEIRQARVSYLSKEIGINQTNENTLSHLDHRYCANCILRVKFLYLYQLYLFDFSLKVLQISRFFTEELGGATAISLMYQLYLFRSLLYLFSTKKIHYFVITSCKNCIFYFIIIAIIKGVLK